MVIQSQIGNVPDDTKLLRFLDVYGGEKSVGQIDHREIYTNFHYGVLGISPPKRTKTAVALDTRGLPEGYTFFKQGDIHQLTSSFPLNLVDHRSSQNCRCLSN